MHGSIQHRTGNRAGQLARNDAVRELIERHSADWERLLKKHREARGLAEIEGRELRIARKKVRELTDRVIYLEEQLRHKEVSP